MTDDPTARAAICARVHQQFADFTTEHRLHQAEVSRLRPIAESLQAEIDQKKREQQSIVDIVPRVAHRISPFSAAIDVGVAIADQVRRGRLQDEIAQLMAQLRPVERDLEAARRGVEDARYKLEKTADNRTRHQCGF